MSVETTVQLKAETIKPNIGARVLNSKAELLSGELANEIRDLLERSGVLVFPQINFTDEEQVAFTKTLGRFAPEMSDKAGEEKTHAITLDPKISATADYLRGSLYWHIDGTMNAVPIRASLLSCKKPSPKGIGNTGFSNTYAAYEALPEAEKAEYEKLRAVHSLWASSFYYEPEPPIEKLKIMQKMGEKDLPLVWNHRSGRKSLVIGCTTHRILGVDPVRSAQIIHGLRDWATQEQFTYSHEWTIGDLVIWDNTGTMHRAEAYDPTCGRMMHRTMLEGEEPFE